MAAMALREQLIVKEEAKRKAEAAFLP